MSARGYAELHPRALDYFSLLVKVSVYFRVLPLNLSVQMSQRDIIISDLMFLKRGCIVRRNFA